LLRSFCPFNSAAQGGINSSPFLPSHLGCFPTCLSLG
jgi:hypothetical protein